MNNNEQLNLLKIFFLISGILNILFAAGWGGYTLIGGLITCGLGCLFGAIPVINVIACVMDFITYNRLNRMNKTGTYDTIQFTAIFDIVTIITGNVVSMVFGIIALIFLNNEETKKSLKEAGIY
ncbi:MAG: hypothetical protein K8I03_02570 [Ignavibacteria bacterium]|nr:hypothetical protein [Ignavibacteria bacterium]